ncbi:hypothetical protein [Abyssogena phaseoliformis symbiont]|uniref:hypothetical protein n=1 Tax=Abyssogena phaseoliformis symbiont TaxID=596095 RepID=UPI0019163BEE|nr:hypothetical protein [Abyssogena phaseoliformis symbiont]MBW5288769.1 hypothetical protein [Candidatus Ruthia sp. Apha_13_S6]
MFKAHAQLTLIYIRQNNKEKATYHYEQMLKWLRYFDGRYGFGPYEAIIKRVNLAFSQR